MELHQRTSMVMLVIALFMCARAASEDPVLHTSTGKLRGFVKTADNGRESEVYMSVPFARPPRGELRFAKPQPYDDPDAEVDATRRHPACPQPPFSLGDDIAMNFTWYSEDCLFLNIFKPVTTATDLPIVVYYFGGSYVHGAANAFIYDGDVFASETNAIYVNVNYRVGMLGFLNTGSSAAPGNQGLWDSLEGLRWVKKNARAIGGNPDDITVWGQSAGAITVGIFIASPAAKGLFHRAILQSGATSTGALLFNRNTPEKTRDAFERLGCMNETDDWESSKDEALSCVKQLDIEAIFDTLVPDGLDMSLLSWQPIIGDDLVPVHPFRSKSQHIFWPREMLMTSVSSEGTLFTEIFEKSGDGLLDALGDIRTIVTFALKLLFNVSLGEARTLLRSYLPDDVEPKSDELKLLISAICGDVLFLCPIQYYADAAVRSGVRVYRGSFEPRMSYSPWPAYSKMGHADDVLLTGGKAIALHENHLTEHIFPRIRMIKPVTKAEAQWSLETVRLFGDFVHNGKPRIPGSQQEWPLYSAEDPQIVYMAPNNFTVVRGLKTDKCALWEPYILSKSKSENVSPKVTTTTMTPSTSAPSQGVAVGTDDDNKEANVIRRGKTLRRTYERIESAAPALVAPSQQLIALVSLALLFVAGPLLVNVGRQSV